ncbi:MAG: hypothetical protein KGO02_07985 [Alphaproteobacteria bacterium]|nr:hypothetical protein [Alphaproteobacteria bacterium]
MKVLLTLDLTHLLDGVALGWVVEDAAPTSNHLRSGVLGWHAHRAEPKTQIQQH